MNKLNYCIALIISILAMQVAEIRAQVQLQEFGVKGKVLDVETYQPIAGVTISIPNTNLGASTDQSGEFFITLPAKTEKIVLVSTFIGYKSDSTSVQLKSNSWEFVPIALVNESSTLEEVVVTRRRERVSEIALLEERRKSSLMVEKMGAQELSRKGVGDVATALSKMSGVSKEEGSNQVYVRGLGDRYNSTSLNGLPIPSNDPERKNIDLDIFSTDIVEHIAIDKAYSSFMSGDFAGGNVDIVSKNYSDNGFIEVSLGSQTNTNVLDKWDGFYLQSGPNRSGFVNYGVPNDPLGGFHFQNSLAPIKRTTPLGVNFGVTGGKSLRFANGQQLNLFAIASHNNDYNFREGTDRKVAAGGDPVDDFRYTRFGYTTNSTGMINASYVINSRHQLAYNLLFINSSDQSREQWAGHIRDLAEDGSGIRQRSTFLQHKLFVNQILGHHQLASNVDLDWGTSYNTVNSRIPDRIQNITRVDETLNYRVLAQNTEPDNHRYFQDLDENEFAFHTVGQYRIGQADAPKGKIAMGYNGKIKRRDFEDIQFNFDMKNVMRQQEADPNNLDALFNQENYRNGWFEIQGYALDFPQIYKGEQDIHAFFANAEYLLTPKLTAILGLRYENIKQSIYYETVLDRSGKTNTFKRNAFLPNLLLKYMLDEKQNLRLGASKTYTLPQFKERALFIYDYGNETKMGNPYLYPSQDYNLDLKWEMFPREAELLSFTLFGKYIKDPINEVTLASSSNDISYVNSGDYGTVYGIEAEIKKDLFAFSNGESKLSVGGNMAYMQTDQELSAEKVARETDFNLNLTDDRSSFTGSSDFLANADLSFSKKWSSASDIMATLTYNYFSDRLYALGTNGKGNQIEKGMGTLDFILKYNINKRFGIDLNLRNMLNPTYERFQDNENGAVTTMSYKKGARYSLTLKYNIF